MKLISSLFGAPSQPADSVRRWGLWSWLAACENLACPRHRSLLPAHRRRSHGFSAEDRWFCSPGCAHEYLLYRVRALLAQFRYSPPRTFRVPIGMVLVNRGCIERGHVLQALQMQKAGQQIRFGECLVKMGLVDERQLAAALSQQWACPFYPLEMQPFEFLPFSIAPLELFLAAQAVPAYLSADSQSLHVAFCYRIDHTSLYALESMLGCRTFPSVATATAVQDALNFQATAIGRRDPFFETVRDPRDITAILISYAAQFHSTKLRLVRTQYHLWARFFLKRSVRDVLFQLPAAQPVQPKGRETAKDNLVSADIRKEVVSTDPARP